MRRFDHAGDRPVLLALRTLKLGDLLVAVPALHGLRRAFPEHELVYATPAWLEPIVGLVGSVDALLPASGLDAPLPLAPGEVDIAANLHGNGPESRAAIDALEARRRIVHAPSAGSRADADAAAGLSSRLADPAAPPWVDGMHERVRWARLVSAHGAPADPQEVRIGVPAAPSAAPGAAVVHAGAAYGSRRWPVDRLAAVARELAADGMRVVVTGGEADRDRARAAAELAGLREDAVLAGRLPLDGFAALVAHASVVATVDTGAAHLASAYGTPSVVVFGPAPVSEWGPPPGPHVVLTDASVRRGDAFADDPDPALLAVGAAEVVEAARRVRRPWPS